MENAIDTEPEEPVRKYYTDNTKASSEETPNNENRSPRVQVVVDALYAVVLQKYLTAHKSWETKDILYKENRSRVYNLFLQHYPESIKTELKQGNKQKEASRSHDMIGLLKILQDLAHGKKEQK